MPILEDGQLFERYRVHKWLGSGIAGESYEAEDRILQRKVTLKLIHPWATLPDSARRQFFREMQGISLLNHPHLATVLDYGEIEGRVYVARRYVSSGSLLSANGRLWFHPPLQVANAFTYAHQLAQALQYIHQHGYIHGSLTFANVLVLRAPNSEHADDYTPFLVADVGLAHFVRRFGHPRLETLPISAAPEQLNKRVVPASDQFALAALLYFWLAGRPPYLGASYEIERQKLNEIITPLSTLNPGVSLEQEGLIARAMRAYPEDRHASVLDFAEALLASLTSPNRQYAAAQPETSHATVPAVPEEETAAANIEVQPLSVEQTPANSIPAPTADPPDFTTPSQANAEPFHSVLEEFLTSPQSKPEHRADHERRSNESDTQKEEEDELAQPEARVLLPRLPETPRVEEYILQADFVHLTPEVTSEPLVHKSTGPLSITPETEILPAETSNFVASPPTPPASIDFTSIDTLPSGQETSLPDTLANEPLAIAEGTTFTQQPEELSYSQAIKEASDAYPIEEVISPGAKEEISVIYAREQATLSLSESATAQADPSSASFANELLATPDEQQEPVSFSNETQPTDEKSKAILLEGEPASPSDEHIDVPSSPEPEQKQEPSSLLIGEHAVSSEETEIILPFAETDQPDKKIVAAFQAEVAPTNTEEEQPASPAEDSKRTLAATPTAPLQELSPTSEESSPAPTLDKPVLSSKEAEPGVSPAEIALREENRSETPPAETSSDAEMHSQAESAAEIPVNQPASSISQSQGPDLSRSMREPLETTGKIYPPIEETLAAPRLIISSPYTSSSFEFVLTDEETHIGRAGASDLYLEQDNLTSRHHALLKRFGDRVLIFDKRSHNGVFLNGQKIEVGRGYELADGDHIGIGNYELIFRSTSTGQISQLI